MSSGIGDAFNREVLGSANAASTASELPEDFKRETLGVTHPGHEAVMAFDPEYFAALTTIRPGRSRAKTRSFRGR
jgi:hypothetical protein